MRYKRWAGPAWGAVAVLLASRVGARVQVSAAFSDLLRGISVTPGGEPGGVSGSRLRSSPALAIVACWGVSQQAEDGLIALSFCLINKIYI